VWATGKKKILCFTVTMCRLTYFHIKKKKIRNIKLQCCRRLESSEQSNFTATPLWEPTHDTVTAIRCWLWHIKKCQWHTGKELWLSAWHELHGNERCLFRVSKLKMQYSSMSGLLVRYIPNCTASGRGVCTTRAGSHRTGTCNFLSLLHDLQANAGRVLKIGPLTKVLHFLPN